MRSKANHRERTQRIQETGGQLRGGTVGNVWEWGPMSWREDALMEETDEVFDRVMDHMECIVEYEKQLHELRQELSAANAAALLPDERPEDVPAEMFPSDINQQAFEFVHDVFEDLCVSDQKGAEGGPVSGTGAKRTPAERGAPSSEQTPK